MKIIFILTFLFCCPTVYAAEQTGIGIVFGMPSGISARHWMEPNRSIAVNAGWSILSKSRFQLNASYLFEKNGVIEWKNEMLDVFFGAGLSLRTKSGNQDGELVLGPRLPLGLSYFFKDPKIEAFLETGLNIGLIPSSDIYLDAGIGVRFFFE